MDFAAKSRLPADMDENATALIALLGTRIGMIMEDTNVTALNLGRLERPELEHAIDMLVRAGSSISILAAALNDLMRAMHCDKICKVSIFRCYPAEIGRPRLKRIVRDAPCFVRATPALPGSDARPRDFGSVRSRKASETCSSHREVAGMDLKALDYLRSDKDTPAYWNLEVLWLVLAEANDIGHLTGNWYSVCWIRWGAG